MQKKKILASFKRSIELLNQKFVTKGLVSGSRIKKSPDPGSETLVYIVKKAVTNEVIFNAICPTPFLLCWRCRTCNNVSESGSIASCRLKIPIRSDPDSQPWTKNEKVWEYLWWCWPPALPRPPGCFLCFPIRPWPWETWPRNLRVFFLHVDIFMSGINIHQSWFKSGNKRNCRLSH